MATTYTFSTLVTELRDFLADMAQDRFNMRDIATAINNAIRDVWPRWFDTVIDETLSYDAQTFEYTMPSSMDDVLEIYLQPKNPNAPWKKVTGWVIREQSATTKKIYFTKAYRQYDGQTMRIIGLRRPQAVLAVKGNSGVGNNTTTFTDSNATFVTNGVAANHKLYIVQSGNNNAAVGNYTVSSVTNETTLVVDTAIPTASQCIYVIINPSATLNLPFTYMLHMAASHLYQIWAHKGVDKDVQRLWQYATFHQQQALLALEEEAKRFRPRSF